MLVHEALKSFPMSWRLATLHSQIHSTRAGWSWLLIPLEHYCFEGGKYLYFIGIGKISRPLAAHTQFNVSKPWLSLHSCDVFVCCRRENQRHSRGQPFSDFYYWLRLIHYLANSWGSLWNSGIPLKKTCMAAGHCSDAMLKPRRIIW